MDKSRTPYALVIDECINEFEHKNKKYGQSWTEDRVFTLAQQVFIKLVRIKTIQELRAQKVSEPVALEFPGIFNYCMLGKIRIKWLREGRIPDHFVTSEDVVSSFIEAVSAVKDLYVKKNHDYGEIWRELYISTMTDFMLAKYRRFETIHLEKSKTEMEKLDDYDEIFKDIANYALFCMANIKDGMDELE